MIPINPGSTDDLALKRRRDLAARFKQWQEMREAAARDIATGVLEYLQSDRAAVYGLLSNVVIVPKHDVMCADLAYVCELRGMGHIADGDAQFYAGAGHISTTKLRNLHNAMLREFEIMVLGFAGLAADVWTLEYVGEMSPKSGFGEQHTFAIPTQALLAKDYVMPLATMLMFKIELRSSLMPAMGLPASGAA